jgi:mRNA-degrading endonuclease RelE of RelBE toxin-antitoxin system
VRIRETRQFEDDYRRLSPQDRERVKVTLRKLVASPGLPGLRFQKLSGATDPDGKQIWYFRASESIRITCVREDDEVFLRRVGAHDILRTP